MQTEVIELIPTKGYPDTHDLSFYAVPELLKLIHQDEVTVNLWLTEQCNFKCKHCFYASSPQSPKGYMSNDLLEEVKRFIGILIDDLQCNVSVNLVGGEPTLNLKEFARIFEQVMVWCQIWDSRLEFQMTTNGWWLNDPKWTLEFFTIIAPYVPSDGMGVENNFAIRISDDQYHRPFRKGKWRQERGIKGLLSDLLEYGTYDEEALFYTEEIACSDCGHTMDFVAWTGTCPECNHEEYDFTGDGKRILSLPQPAEGDPWIYVEDHLDASLVIPSNDWCDWGRNDLGLRGGERGCGHHSIVTFDPKGMHRDGCCRGSDMPFTTIDDHPLVTLGINNFFLQSHRPTCVGCRSDATFFAESDDMQKALAFYRHVARSMRLDRDDQDEYVFVWHEPHLPEDVVIEMTMQEVQEW